MKDVGLSIITPSYLGHYEGAATDRLHKLHRAVMSFITSLPRREAGARELVIVSDGCDETDSYFGKLAKHFASDGSETWVNDKTCVRHVRVERTGRFAGRVRNTGIEAARGPIIAYLDSDDYVRPDHFLLIEQNFGDSDWVWFDDNLWPNQYRRCGLEYGHIGTSCIAHKRDLPVRWVDEYNHDWRLVQDLMKHSDNYRYIGDGGYIVCHVPNRLDA